MRVWLVDDREQNGNGCLEALLRQLERCSGADVRLLGVSPFQPDFVEAMRKLVPELLDLLVINERAWPEGARAQEVFGLGRGMVVVPGPERASRFQPLADMYPLVFAPRPLDTEGLWLALLAASAGQRREVRWQKEVARLQQRLQDRIVIERAKGIMIQRLAISEEEAYRRLRILARRQRRQIRDIAQSLLDSQALLAHDRNLFAVTDGWDAEPKGEMDEQTVLNADS